MLIEDYLFDGRLEEDLNQLGFRNNFDFDHIDYTAPDIWIKTYSFDNYEFECIIEIDSNFDKLMFDVTLRALSDGDFLNTRFTDALISARAKVAYDIDNIINNIKKCHEIKTGEDFDVEVFKEIIDQLGFKLVAKDE